MPKRRLTKIERFEKLFTKSNPRRCWVWRGNTFTSGCALFQDGNKRIKASRFSYRLYKGEIPEGLNVCHRCDNPLCVNPHHLFLGTQLDNMRDMIAKGRKRVLTGELHGMNKLSDQQVEEIRAKYIRTGPFQSNGGKLAKEYGVHVETIRRIATGKRRTQGSGKVSPGKSATGSATGDSSANNQLTTPLTL